jgi:hypothetical protein
VEQLAVLDTTSPPVVLRRAVADDLPAMVALLAADPLGASREADPSDPSALRPFIPGLARRGA